MKNMREKRKSGGGIHEMLKSAINAGLIQPFLYLMLMTVFISGCTKDETPIDNGPELMTVAGIAKVIPLNLTDSIVVDPVVSVTFNQGTDPATISASASTLTLKKGNTPVPGTTSVSGTTAIFTPVTDLSQNTVYTATITAIKKSGSDSHEIHEYTWKFKTGKHHSVHSLSIVALAPVNNATAAPATSLPTITFNHELTSSMKKTISVVLKKGTAIVEGSLSFSGSDAIFKPTANLSPNTQYNGMVRFGGENDEGENDEGENDEGENDEGENNNSGKTVIWSFTTGGDSGNDATAPTIGSVRPASNAVSVATATNCTVTFSEPMNSATITPATFTLKLGTIAVAGTISYLGTTATFTPTAALASNTSYTGTVTTGVKDAAGNALAANYSWTFTTVSAAVTDVIPPTVLSSIPISNATVVAVNVAPSVIFSEAMNSTTITSSTFTLKQGTTPVAGTVTYSGNTAKFAPAAVLAGNTVYTATITTGVKDAAGNALAANHSWSFTTIASVAGLSFASDVVPVLNLCNTCHTHGWTTSTVSSTFYANLVSAGYVNAASPTSGKIYTKLNGGHPGSVVTLADVNKILTWITEGSKNN
jgi:hypothetical protein